MPKRAKERFEHFILDVDGVLTDGQFHVSARDGKVMKIFGPDDNDALKLLPDEMDVLFVTGDKRGFPITKKRVEDEMKRPLFLVSTFERVGWIEENYGLDESIYMGDGIFDAMVFDKVGYGIAPANAFEKIKPHADYVTAARGGQGAVAEAVWHIMEKFFEPLDILNLSHKGGIWGR